MDREIKELLYENFNLQTVLNDYNQKYYFERFLI